MFQCAERVWKEYSVRSTCNNDEHKGSRVEDKPSRMLLQNQDFLGLMLAQRLEVRGVYSMSPAINFVLSVVILSRECEEQNSQVN